MSELLLHPTTAQAVDNFVIRPSHALLLLAPAGAGKTMVAQSIAARLLNVPTDKLVSHPYVRMVESPNNKTISIEDIRDVIHFLMLKTGAKAETNRIVIIEHAQLLSTQAQNALLKTIEEPPQGTVLILTAPSELDILPTIRSRVQKLVVQPPTTEQLTEYFHGQGFTGAAISKALLMSDGLPGLTQALLTDDASHPLVAATAQARDILQKTAFERVVLVDELAKQKQQWLDTLFILERMAETSLRKPGTATAALKRWHGILSASHMAREQTLASGQLKLVVLNFMLSL